MIYCFTLPACHTHAISQAQLAYLPSSEDLHGTRDYDVCILFFFMQKCRQSSKWGTSGKGKENLEGSSCSKTTLRQRPRIFYTQAHLSLQSYLNLPATNWLTCSNW